MCFHCGRLVFPCRNGIQSLACANRGSTTDPCLGIFMDSTVYFCFFGLNCGNRINNVDILNYTNWCDFLKWVMQNDNSVNVSIVCHYWGIFFSLRGTKQYWKVSLHVFYRLARMRFCLFSFSSSILIMSSLAYWFLRSWLLLI